MSIQQKLLCSASKTLKSLFIKSLFLFCFLVVYSSIHAQRPIYKITATLNSFGTDTMRGTIDITWTNRSNAPLDKLGIHLWPNAYSDRNSTLSKQMVEQGHFDLLHARDEDLGGLYDLAFTSASGLPQKLTLDENNIDIGWINLNTPLNPHATIHLSSAYTLIIPKSFSRLGRTGDAYQLTQWYPHIAVYDDQGWHMMPYLDQGEYYNDFADYEVSITVPQRYKVAATGVLQSSEQKGDLIQWNFKASNVIDFAFFASPTFRHETLKVNVGAEEPVELNIYTDAWNTQDWKSAVLYGERALKFYSDWLGPYPYPQMSVVDAPFSKGGFMEYPMVAQIGATVDAAELDRVIAHEIGHTWLYGILASDERTHPWLDEGFNSFMEEQYMKAYYKDADESVFPTIIRDRHSMPDNVALKHAIRFNGDLQPSNTPPEHQKSDQYLLSAYLLPEEGLDMMLSMVGEEKMKMMFRQYFQDRKFTHVAPADIKASFEKICNCDLTWFFDGWANHAHEVDYRLKKFDSKLNNVTIENHGTSTIPVLVSGYEGHEKVTQNWIDGFAGKKVIHLDKNVDEVRLYDGLMGVNKNWQANSKPRNFKPSLTLFPKISNYFNPEINVTPVLGNNIADGFMTGLALTSGLFPQHHLKWFVMPMYGYDSQKIRYYGEGRYITDLKSNLFDKLLISVAASSFGYNLDTSYQFIDHFLRVSPSVGLKLNTTLDQPHLTRWIKYRYVDITQYYGKSNINNTYSRQQRHYGIHELAYQMSSDVSIMPYKAVANIQAGNGFVRLNVNYHQHFLGKDKMHGLWVHGFGGWLPYFNNSFATTAFSFNGIPSSGTAEKDYMFDEWLSGRNETGGLSGHQLFMRDAELKTLATVGISEKWMLAGGVSTALPLKYLHVYMDGTLYHSGVEQKPVFSYTGGLAVILWKDVFEVYVPILESRDIRESINFTYRNMWFDKICFQANFKLANPLNVVDGIQLKY
ncbi:MAG: M1 family metallopeptidase [Saprospiraceae bacterium]|uniref:M1 family metallopeptidase n=1 Tax=Candidatus Opimibacter skivensis TaxID=2982028 RepID=A0A9D7XM04_9BACT|nr:M1 family metallopeptidase [Candidatus Opimibacter skivensis]